jgi:plastocyanin
MNSRSIAILTLVLAACEGEPPKTPVGAVAAGPSEPVAAVATTEEPSPAASAPAAPAPGGALPPCACACNCAGGAPVAADGGIPAAVAGGVPAAVAATPPPAAAPASISGTVTTTPKWAAGSAIVYLEDAPVLPTAKMTTTVANHQMNFVPYVSVVPTGGKVTFRNDDPFPHNVFSPDNEKFNMGMIGQGEARARVFTSAGVYSLLCNVHPGMLGYVVVTPSGYYAKANVQGHFAIKDVPPGTYKVTAWAPRQQPVTQSVTVKAGNVDVNFEIHR